MEVGASSSRGLPSPIVSDSGSDVSNPATISSASSTNVTLSSKIPLEVLTQILSYVPFHDLYESLFVHKLILTNYAKLFTTASGCDEDSMLDAKVDRQDDTWQGVALSLPAASEFSGLMDVKWRGAKGRKLYLIVREACTASETPYIVRAGLLTYKEQYDLYEEDYAQVIKLSLDQSRPVLLDVIDFDEYSGEIHLDLTECYRAIYWEYRNSLREMRALAELLEADLWTPWCERHAKYWGKKKAGVHAEGIFIDIVESVNERTFGVYGDLEAVFIRYDLYRRKVYVLEQMSLHDLARNRNLDFDEYYRHLPATWADSNPAQSEVQVDRNTKAICRHHEASFDRTIKFMVHDFEWSDPGNVAHGIIPTEEYEEMLQTWYDDMTAAWSRTRVIHQTTYHRTAMTFWRRHYFYRSIEIQEIVK